VATLGGATSSRSYAYDLQERRMERLFVTCPCMSYDVARMTVESFGRFSEAQRLTVHRYSTAQVRVGLLAVGFENYDYDGVTPQKANDGEKRVFVQDGMDEGGFRATGSHNFYTDTTFHIFATPSSPTVAIKSSHPFLGHHAIEFTSSKPCAPSRRAISLYLGGLLFAESGSS
jgi:hypothetical protein